MKRFMLLILSVLLSLRTFAAITVSDVEVFSGYPWKEVVVGYTITGTDANAEGIRLAATDKAANRTYVTWTGSSALTGAKMSEGRHVLRWNAASEGVKFSSADVVFAVSVVEYGGVQLWEN